MHEPHVVPGAIKRTLEELRLKYLDLYLIHWPIALEFTGYNIPVGNPKHENGMPKFAKVTLSETWKAMEVQEKLENSTLPSFATDVLYC